MGEPTPHRLSQQVTLDAAGAGEATVTARGRFRAEHTRVSVGPAPGSNPPRTILQPQVTTYIDGEEYESTYSGSKDQSDSVFVLTASQSVRCVWTGGDPGALATLIIRGWWL